MIVGIVLLVASRGLVVFWPRPLIELSLKDGKKYIVEELAREQIPAKHEQPDLGERLQVRLANRDLYGLDFRWIPQSEIAARTVPPTPSSSSGRSTARSRASSSPSKRKASRRCRPRPTRSVSPFWSP